MSLDQKALEAARIAVLTIARANQDKGIRYTAATDAAKLAIEAYFTALSGPGEAFPCEDCGGPTLVWFAPNKLWNLVMGGPEAKGDPGGMLCPNCFIRRAEKAGVCPTAWVVGREDLAALPPPTAAVGEVRNERLNALIEMYSTNDPVAVWPPSPTDVDILSVLTELKARRSALVPPPPQGEPVTEAMPSAWSDVFVTQNSRGTEGKYWIEARFPTMTAMHAGYDELAKAFGKDRAISAQPTAGWRLVPIEPTEAMYAAANREWDGRMSARSCGVWQAMIAAAPPPSANAGQVKP